MFYVERESHSNPCKNACYQFYSTGRLNYTAGRAGPEGKRDQVAVLGK